MTVLRISIPVYKRDTYHNLAEQGIIEVSADCDNLSDAYERLKPQIADLLLKTQAESQIVVTLNELEAQIRDRRSVLQTLSGQIVRANKQLERLRNFLESIGISPSASSLTISDSVVRNLHSAEIVIVDDDDSSSGNYEF